MHSSQGNFNKGWVTLFTQKITNPDWIVIYPMIGDLPLKQLGQVARLDFCYFCIGQFQNRPCPTPHPRQPRGIWLFWKILVKFCAIIASLDGQMPHPLELQRGSNPSPSRHAKATVETSSAKFSATTNFLFSLSSLHTLNKGILHDITI